MRRCGSPPSTTMARRCCMACRSWIRWVCWLSAWWRWRWPQCALCARTLGVRERHRRAGLPIRRAGWGDQRDEREDEVPVAATLIHHPEIEVQVLGERLKKEAQAMVSIPVGEALLV